MTLSRTRPMRFYGAPITLAVPVQPLPLRITLSKFGTYGQKERFAYGSAFNHLLSPLMRARVFYQELAIVSTYLTIGGETMPEKWTGQLVGLMHNERITYADLAKELGVTKTYISMILNGSRKPAGIRERMRDAVNNIIQERNSAKDSTML